MSGWVCHAFCASHAHSWAALVVARIRTTHLRMLNVVRKMKQNLAENVQSGICSWIGTFVSRGITVLETSDPVQDFTRNLLLVRRHWVYTFYILFLIKLETRFCWRWVPQRNDWVVYPCLCPFLMYGLWKVNTLCSFSCRCSCCKPSSILHNFKSLYHRVFTVNSAADKNKPWTNHRFTDPSPPPHMFMIGLLSSPCTLLYLISGLFPFRSFIALLRKLFLSEAPTQTKKWR